MTGEVEARRVVSDDSATYILIKGLKQMAAARAKMEENDTKWPSESGKQNEPARPSQDIKMDTDDLTQYGSKNDEQLKETDHELNKKDMDTRNKQLSTLPSIKKETDVEGGDTESGVDITLSATLDSDDIISRCKAIMKNKRGLNEQSNTMDTTEDSFQPKMESESQVSTKREPINLDNSITSKPTKTDSTSSLNQSQYNQSSDGASKGVSTNQSLNHQNTSNKNGDIHLVNRNPELESPHNKIMLSDSNEHKSELRHTHQPKTSSSYGPIDNVAIMPDVSIGTENNKNQGQSEEMDLPDLVKDLGSNNKPDETNEPEDLSFAGGFFVEDEEESSTRQEAGKECVYKVTD